MTFVPSVIVRLRSLSLVASQERKYEQGILRVLIGLGPFPMPTVAIFPNPFAELRSRSQQEFWIVDKQLLVFILSQGTQFVDNTSVVRFQLIIYIPARFFTSSSL
jgi:hypothetical protein